MKLSEIIDNCTVDLMAATKESDKTQQQRLITATLRELRDNITNYVGGNIEVIELTEHMTVNEYQDRFNELFTRLQKEHGKPKNVYITSNDICDDTGYVVESTPICSIEF